MPKTCCACGCGENSDKNKSGGSGRVHFHRFPNREKSPKRFERWVQFCGRSFKPSRHSRICSLHFTQNDLETSSRLKEKLLPGVSFLPRLNSTAVPTVRKARNEEVGYEEIRLHVNEQVRNVEVRDVHVRKSRRDVAKRDSDPLEESTISDCELPTSSSSGGANLNRPRSWIPDSTRRLFLRTDLSRPNSLNEENDNRSSSTKCVHQARENFSLADVSNSHGEDGVGIKVGHCEEELANIESSYQRSPNRSALGNDKQRKPHFQQEQLRFLKPGVTAARSGRDVSGTDSGAPPDVTSDADANHPGRHDVTIKIEPDDQLDIEHNLSTEDVEDPPKPSIFVTPLNYTPAIEEVTESVGKRPATEELCELQTKIQCLEASMEALKKTPTATLTPTPTQTPSRDSLGEQNGMRYFLLSLLPELETMPEEQIRAFKIKVMMLVDEIKSQSKR
ncbi:uncharacterized protein [Bemisia tabaci]|uniref:uncharacterized protein isoform X2 n=1 Tax=Bemisia tabaci TaxID=7038 RepID=UPI003B28CD49